MPAKSRNQRIATGRMRVCPSREASEMPTVIPKQRKRHISQGPNCAVLHWNVKNLTGQIFGELKVLRDSGTRNRQRQVLWECLCSCGMIVVRDGSTLSSGKSISCGHTRFTPEANAKRGLAGHRPKAALKKSYRQYYYAAIARGYVFSLSLDEFESLATKVCFYCGCLPSMVKTAKSESRTLNGIDRVDNTKGYHLNNCVPCCTVCNRMKLTLARDEFLAHINRIVCCQQEKDRV